MTLVWYFFPKNVHGGFQMLTGFVQQVHVGWVLDVSRSHGGIHHELTPIFLLLLFLFQLLFGGILVLFATLGRLLLYICVRRIGMIVLGILVLRIITVNIPLLLWPYPSADILVDVSYFLHWETLAKVHHHGGIE